jgi:hypothetical protein
MKWPFNLWVNFIQEIIVSIYDIAHIICEIYVVTELDDDEKLYF